MKNKKRKNTPIRCLGKNSSQQKYKPKCHPHSAIDSIPISTRQGYLRAFQAGTIVAAPFFKSGALKQQVSVS
jgi:hypothetical protein